MATYTLDEVMGGKKTYSIDEVMSHEPQSPLKNGLDVLSSANKIASVASPLGLIKGANDLGNNLVRQGAEVAADKTMDATNSPSLATAVQFSPDIASLLASGYVSNSLPQMISSGASKASAAAARLGINPTWAQRSNSPTLMQIEDTLRRMPGGGGVFGANDIGNAKAVNTAAASAIGQKSDRVTGEVLANSEDALGSARDKLRQGVNISQGDTTVLSAIQNASSDLKKSLRGSGVFNNDMERIKQGINGGDIAGEQYQIWRTDLRGAMDTAYKAGKAKLGDAYKKVLGSLDEAARGSSGKDWKENDKAFSTLDILQKGNVVNPETGNVSPSLLTNAFFQKFGKTAKQGKMPGPIADIASTQKAYPKWAEGSPTGKVESYSSLVPWLLSPASWAAAHVLTSNPYELLRLAPYANTLGQGVTEKRVNDIQGLLYGNNQ